MIQRYFEVHLHNDSSMAKKEKEKRNKQKETKCNPLFIHYPFYPTPCPISGLTPQHCCMLTPAGGPQNCLLHPSEKQHKENHFILTSCEVIMNAQ